MSKKVIEKTEGEFDDASGKAEFWTTLSFVGGIDLSGVRGRLRDSEHIRLVTQGREWTLVVGTTSHYVQGEYPSKYSYNISVTSERRSGARNDMGYLELETSEESVAFRKHRDAVNALKSAYFRKKVADRDSKK